MSRSKSIVAVLLLSAGVAHGQGEVASYFVAGVSGTAIIPSVPVGGFVITDIVTRGFTGDFRLEENGTPIVVIDISATNRSMHFNSGLVVAEGSTVTINVPGADEITISGYIPCTNPCDPCVLNTAGIPAIGNGGLGVMVLLLLVAGAYTINKRQRQPA